MQNRRDVVQQREHCFLGHVQQEWVALRHGLEQHLELEVLHKILRAGRRLLFEVEVAISVHQESLHDASLCFSDP